ncbi:MAG TPA: glycosyltransferase family 4 protein [Gemmatimonadaceae bacterium]|nr:glycosyltransferase family 4 protein [Gemmatimonadaceae bacterium]
MTRRRRPSILYAVPGHDFLQSAGPTRNVLNQVHAMSAWADFTLLFRRIVSPPEPSDPPVVEIQPEAARNGSPVDDAATRGMSYPAFAAYLRAVRRSMRTRLPAADLVLEKDWMLTGYVSRVARAHGTPSIPVKNRVAGSPGRVMRDPLKWARHATGGSLEGWLLRQAPCMVAETEPLKRAMVSRWQLDPARIEVIGLGVDRRVFRPARQEPARSELRIPQQPTVLLYAGILDRTHDLDPLLRALAASARADMQLHIVGDGPERGAFEALARDARVPVVFHGRVAHADVPRYVAAADLCVAPYNPSAFPTGEVGYATLKVREFLAAARPVATVASGTLRELVRDGVSGFLLDNTVERWGDLLRALPPRARLAKMGAAAADTPLESWEDVSSAFERVCARQIAMTSPDGGPVREPLPCTPWTQ